MAKSLTVSATKITSCGAVADICDKVSKARPALHSSDRGMSDCSPLPFLEDKPAVVEAAADDDDCANAAADDDDDCVDDDALWFMSFGPFNPPLPPPLDPIKFMSTVYTKPSSKSWLFRQASVARTMP